MYDDVSITSDGRREMRVQLKSKTVVFPVFAWNRTEVEKCKLVNFIINNI
jgi:hypothetical protein